MLRRRLVKLLAGTALLPGCSGNSFKSQKQNLMPLRRIAFGSCAADWQDQPIWTTILNAKPDLYISAGDAIYADYDGEKLIPVTEESLRDKWQTLAEKDGFRTFREQIPIVATWDNHDYGNYSQGEEFPLKKDSKNIFLDFWREPEASQRRKRPGIYDAAIYGPLGKRIQVILLDTRTFKSPAAPDKRNDDEKQALNIIGRFAPNFDPKATLLGDAQWRWLHTELTKPAEIRLIVSSTQFAADEKGMDEWGNYPLEKQRMLTLLKDVGANGVIFLSGNVHFTEISQEPEFPYPLIDFTSSGMTPSNINPRYAGAKNSKRVAGPFIDVNFGLVSIDWQADGNAEIVLSAHNRDGAEVLKYAMNSKALAHPS